MKGTGKIKLAAAAAIPAPSSPAPSPLEAEPLFGVLRDGVRRTKVVESGRIVRVFCDLAVDPNAVPAGVAAACQLFDTISGPYGEIAIAGLAVRTLEPGETTLGYDPAVIRMLGVPREPEQTPDSEAGNGGAV